ncbi:hypothetical protein MRB53_009019 [Persea americana]|uniref:Uncharacterized protein n=1 Tax=Persea americana TaxID=3435 RepID=A0ACC2LMS2_PERAE|nr:hypothetical protein MRB53_009019 [Persea americana]
MLILGIDRFPHLLVGGLWRTNYNPLKVIVIASKDSKQPDPDCNGSPSSVVLTHKSKVNRLTDYYLKNGSRRWRRLPCTAVIAIAGIRICCAVAVDGEEGMSVVDKEDPDCSTVV